MALSDSDAVTTDAVGIAVRWPLWVAAGVIVALAVTTVVLVSLPEPRRPERVLIAVAVRLSGDSSTGYWWHDDGLLSAVWTDHLSAELAPLGYELVDTSNAETVTAVAGARDDRAIAAGAMEIGIGQMVTGVVEIERETWLRSDVVEVCLAGELFVTSLGVSGGRGPALPVRGCAAAADRETAARLAVEPLSRSSSGAVAEHLGQDRDIEALFALENPVKEEIERAEKLSAIHDFAVDRRRRFSRRRELLANAQAEFTADERGNDVTALTTYGLEAYLLGVHPNGEGVMALIKPRRPYTSVSHPSIALEAMHEAVALSTGDGRLREQVTAWNVFSFPDVSGDWVAMVTDDHGYGMSLRWVKTTPNVVVVADSALLTEDHGYLSFPVVSADRRRVAVRRRTCRACASGLELVGTDGHHRELLEAPHPTRGVGLVGWLGAGHDTLVVERYGGDEPTEVVVRNLEAGTETVLIEAQPNQELDGLALTNNRYLCGIRVVEETRTLVLHDTMTGEAREIADATRISNPRASHDGTLITAEWTGSAGKNDTQRRDSEIVVITLAGDKVFLTNNGHRDRYPRFGPGDEHVYFETQHRDPQDAAPRMMIRQATVPTSIKTDVRPEEPKPK